MTPMLLLLFIVIVFVFLGWRLIDRVQRMNGAAGSLRYTSRALPHRKYTCDAVALAVSGLRKMRPGGWPAVISAPVAVTAVMMPAPAAAIAPLKR